MFKANGWRTLQRSAHLLPPSRDPLPVWGPGSPHRLAAILHCELFLVHLGTKQKSLKRKVVDIDFSKLPASFFLQALQDAIFKFSSQSQPAMQENSIHSFTPAYVHTCNHDLLTASPQKHVLSTEHGKHPCPCPS